MRTYAYLRSDCLMSDNKINYHLYLYNIGHVVKKNRVIVEFVSSNKSILYRDEFMGLINFALEEGDLLIVKGIDCLGKDYFEIINTLDFLEKKILE